MSYQKASDLRAFQILDYLIGDAQSVTVAAVVVNQRYPEAQGRWLCSFFLTSFPSLPLATVVHGRARITVVLTLPRPQKVAIIYKLD